MHNAKNNPKKAVQVKVMNHKKLLQLTIHPAPSAQKLLIELYTHSHFYKQHCSCITVYRPLFECVYI